MTSDNTVNQALALEKAGRTEQAAEVFSRLFEAAPTDLEVLLAFGRFCLRQNAPDLARDLFATATVEHPSASQAHAELGSVLGHLGDFDLALACLNQALTFEPGDPDILVRIGALLSERMPAEAESFYRLALQIEPRNTAVMVGLALAIWRQEDEYSLRLDRVDEALLMLERALAIEPQAQAYRVLGAIYGKIARSKAVESFSRAVALNARAADYTAMGNGYKDLGRTDDAVLCYEKAEAMGDEVAACNRRMSQHYSDTFGNRDFLAEARAYQARHPAGAAFPAPVTAREPDRPLRVGYVSGDFKRHPVGIFMAGVLGAHGPDVQAHCFDTNPAADEYAARIRATAVHHDIRGLALPDAMAAIRGAGIDILVDLSGFTAGNRLDLFAHRAAPVQAAWLGYFGTTGLDTMDYVIADRFVIPEGEEEFFTETVVRLPDSYLCFTPPFFDVAIEPTAPLTRLGRPSFGCVNYPAKISSRCVDVWSDILKAVPDAQLVFNHKFFVDPSIRADLKGRFKHQGVNMDRLVFSADAGRAEFMGRLNDVDVALDPFPFGGGTTTAETLWMGVPVVNLRGDRWVGRVSDSLLQTVGLPELVAANEREYVEIAVRAISDVERLNRWRRTLRNEMLASPLCDADRFTRALEGAFRTMWREWCNKGAAA